MKNNINSIWDALKFAVKSSRAIIDVKFASGSHAIKNTANGERLCFFFAGLCLSLMLFIALFCLIGLYMG